MRAAEEGRANIPAFSMPLTAASDTVRSTFLTVSLAVSRTEARKGEVEKKRVWRANGRILERAKDMVTCSVNLVGAGS